jgi:hypothetical protein
VLNLSGSSDLSEGDGVGRGVARLVERHGTKCPRPVEEDPTWRPEKDLGSRGRRWWRIGCY